MTKRRSPDKYRRLRRALALRERLKLTGRPGRDYTRAVKRAIATSDRSVAPQDRLYVQAEALRMVPRKKARA